MFIHIQFLLVILESSNEGRTYNHSNTHSKRYDEYHHSKILLLIFNILIILIKYLYTYIFS